MNNLQAARDACAHARQQLSTHKSVNKRRLGKYANQQSWERAQYEAKLKHGNLRRGANADSAFPTWNIKQVAAYGKKAEAAGVGNCMEMAAVACGYLSSVKGAPAFHVCTLSPPADHVFVVIGQDPQKGRFPDDFSTWDDEAAVCDPWANIACLANDYPQAWDSKMEKWASRGKEIQGGEDKGAMALAPKWISPADWKSLPTKHGKICTASASGGAKSGCCYLTTAACRSLKLPDDCRELEVLRWFRDHVLLPTPSGRRAVEEYYQRAPSVVSRIDRRPDAARVYRAIHRLAISPAVEMVEGGDFAGARRLFETLLRATREDTTRWFEAAFWNPE
jgi:hypothetical protein